MKHLLWFVVSDISVSLLVITSKPVAKWKHGDESIAENMFSFQRSQEAERKGEAGVEGTEDKIWSPVSPMTYSVILRQLSSSHSSSVICSSINPSVD